MKKRTPDAGMTLKLLQLIYIPGYASYSYIYFFIRTWTKHIQHSKVFLVVLSKSSILVKYIFQQVYIWPYIPASIFQQLEYIPTSIYSKVISNYFDPFAVFNNDI
ncbi:hypothetical protein V6Z11_D07G100400 [Gossypium hirsutum]